MSVPEIQLEKVIPDQIFKHELKASISGIGKLVAALSAARPKFDAIKKTTNNPFYNKKYADISAIIDATAGPLAEQGVYVLQFPTLDGRTVGVTTLVAHSSGEWIESTISGCPADQKTKEGAKFDAQTIGIAITYCRRYSLQAALNLAAEDDDGNGLVDQSDKKELPKRFGPVNIPANTIPQIIPPKAVIGGGHFVTGMTAVPVPSPLMDKPVQVPNADTDGCPLSDSDLPKPDSPLPTPLEKTAYGSRLKALKQDSRILKSYVEKQAGCLYTHITKKQFEEIIPVLEAALTAGTIGELIKA